MAYEIETKDGIVIRGIPDTVKPDDPSIKAKVANARFQRDAANPDYRKAGDMALEGMTGGEKFDAGVGKAIVDTGRGLRQLGRTALDVIAPRSPTLSGLVTGQDPSRSAEDMRDFGQTRARDAALMDTGAGIAGNVVGNIGIALAPGGLLKGASMSAAAGRAAPALNAAGSALLAPKTIAGAAALGAGMGAIQPVAGEGERGINTGVGAVAGAAIPAIVRGAQALKATTEPFYDQGQQNIIGRLLRRAAGSDADGAMQRLASAGELVPGSVPTAGQAAGNAGIAAVERASSAIDPSVTTAYAQRMAEQNAARVAALTGAAGDVSTLTAARDAAVKPLYEAAKKQIVTGDKGLDTLLARPSMKKAWARAQQLAAEQGDDVFAKGSAAKEVSQLGSDGIPRIVGVPAESPEFAVKGLHYLKLAIDDLIENPAAAGIGSNEARAINSTKKSLLAWLEAKVPEYGQARTTYNAMSKPINQAEIISEIAGKAINPLRGELQGHAFAKSISDATAKRATGFGGATLENTLSQDQRALLDALRNDLARADYAKTAGRGVGSDTVQKLAYSNLIDSAGIPTWLRALPPLQVVGNVAGRGADALYGRANKEMANRLAMALLNSEEAAAMMAAANRPTPQIAAALRKAGTPLLMSAPGLINAQKQ